MSDAAGFIHPEVLWVLAALVPLVGLWVFLRRRGDRRLERFLVRDNWGLLNRTVSGRNRVHKGVLVLLALALSIVAAARPYWGTRERTVQLRGTSVIYAIDVSDSMRAADILPSRLDYAKTLIQQVLTETPGNRVALMPFAGDAFLQCPLTGDYGIVRDILRQVDFSSVGYPGTDFPVMIDQAIEAFERTGSGQRALVVLTDGEDHSEAITAAAGRAAEANIRIYALGIGTEDGGPIVMPDGSLKEAPDGTKVLSRLNPEILRVLADESGGRAYVSGITGRFDPSPLIAEINNLAKEDFGEERRVVREEIYQWPLALALLCLVIDQLLSDRRRTPRRAPTPRHREGIRPT